MLYMDGITPLVCFENSSWFAPYGRYSMGGPPYLPLGSESLEGCSWILCSQFRASFPFRCNYPNPFLYHSDLTQFVEFTSLIMCLCHRSWMVCLYMAYIYCFLARPLSLAILNPCISLSLTIHSIFIFNSGVGALVSKESWSELRSERSSDALPATIIAFAEIQTQRFLYTNPTF